MHNANVAKSSRLKMLLDVLKDCAEHSTQEIQQLTGSMAPATDVSELRHNGITVLRRYAGKNQNGRQINYYSLINAVTI